MVDIKHTPATNTAKHAFRDAYGTGITALEDIQANGSANEKKLAKIIKETLKMLKGAFPWKE